MCDCAHSKSSLLHGRAIVNGSVHPPLPSYTDGFTNVNNEPVNEIFEDPFEDRLEPIVVIGMAMRGPQDATSPEALWKMIREGRSAMTEIPSNRFNPDAFCETENPRIGSVSLTKLTVDMSLLTVFEAERPWWPFHEGGSSSL